jgi:hypothetical protein
MVLIAVLAIAIADTIIIPSILDPGILKLFTPPADHERLLDSP